MDPQNKVSKNQKATRPLLILLVYQLKSQFLEITASRNLKYLNLYRFKGEIQAKKIKTIKILVHQLARKDLVGNVKPTKPALDRSRTYRSCQ